jgi:hypothetical protein
MRPDTETMPRLSIHLLHSIGALPKGAVSAGRMTWQQAEGDPLLTAHWHIHVPPTPDADGWIDLEMSAPGQEPSSQRITLRWGWCGWLFSVPGNERLLWRLYCPPDRAPLRFDTRQAHALRDPSDGVWPERRPISHLHHLKSRLETAKPGSAKARKLEIEVAEMELKCLLGVADRLRNRNDRLAHKKGASLPPDPA